MARPLRMGLDIGSTTIKLVLLDGETIRYSTYRRHHADVVKHLAEFADDVSVVPPVGRVPDGLAVEQDELDGRGADVQAHPKGASHSQTSSFRVRGPLAG